MPLDAPVSADASWISLPAAALVPDTAAVLAVTEAKLGYVRNQQRVLAHKPAILTALTALGDAVVRDEAGALTPRERVLIALVVSVENRCEACVFAHAAALRGHSGDTEWVATIEVNFRRARLSPRERALADYALAVTRAPAEVEPAQIETLRGAGLTELAIVEAATVAAYFNLTNRLNSALGIRANSQAYHSNR